MSLAVLGTLAAVGGASLAIDVFCHDSKKDMTMMTAVKWCIFWVFVAACMGGLIYWESGAIAAGQYVTGYLMEKSLSLDNLVVFMAVFSFFGISKQSSQQKILTFGIIGAIVFRGFFASVGTALFHLNVFVQILFGLVVIYSAVPILKEEDEDDEPTDFNEAWYVKALNKLYPFDATAGHHSFFIKKNGKRFMTSMLVAVVTIILSDVMFSFDSVPAVIAVAKDPDIVYSSMMMAVLGLRALYFVIEVLVKKLHLLEKAVGVILLFVGAKLIIAPWFEVPALFSVVIVLTMLAIGVIGSLVIKQKAE